jgi:hypothetical protein|tara:strand:+ start:2746 stop:3195 length:450 start_codon:yes stop_codon:yes gene_type:complete
MPTEPLPINDFLTDLEGQWTFSNVSGSSAKPAFIEVTGSGEPMRFDLNVNDHFIGRAGSPAMDEVPIGNWIYGNRSYNISLEIYTLTSRQRLYDLMRELRRVCHSRKHSLTNFQRLQFTSFNEQTTEQARVWSGTASIQLINNAVLLET